MSLDNINVIDAIGTDVRTGAVVLNILDSWDWDDPRSHLLALQNKINVYFGFVESGEIYEEYPEAVGKALRIQLLSRFPIPPVGVAFLEKASHVAAELKITVGHSTG